MSHFRVVCLSSSSKTPIQDLNIEREILTGAGAETELAIADTEEATLAAVRDADAILHRGGRLTSQVMRQLTRCRIIAHGGVGYDSLDIETATECGIIVTNVADYCIDEVSDHALLFLLALGKRLIVQTEQAHHAVWLPQQPGPISRLRDQSVAVVGYGRIGSTFGRKAQALGLRVLAVDPFVDPADLVAQGAEPCTLEAALPVADFVSLHVPLTPLTRFFFGEAQFRRMKSTAFFINTARGAVVEERALVRALRAGWIAGAGLDVLEHEPPDPANPLLGLENVIVTPHAAYYSTASVSDVRRTMARQVADALTGHWPRFVVNPDVRPAAALRPARVSR